MKQVVMRVAPFPIRPLIEGRRRAGITPERWHSARSPWSGMGHLRPAGFCQRESAHPRKASATLIVASRFFRVRRPIPAALCPRQSGDATRRRAVSRTRRTRSAASPQWRETPSLARDRSPRRQWASTADKPDCSTSPIRRRRLGIGDLRLWAGRSSPRAD